MEFNNAKYEIETYPDMFLDYEEGTENPNYDNETRVFCVPLEWAKRWIEIIADMTMEEFENEYTWDESFAMYEAAVEDNVILYEAIIER